MFSEMELKVLTIITTKPISISDITKLLYPKDRPMEANNYIAGVVRRIKNKCEYNKLDWSLVSTGGGRGGIMVSKTKEIKHDTKRTTKRTG